MITNGILTIEEGVSIIPWGGGGRIIGAHHTISTPLSSPMKTMAGIPIEQAVLYCVTVGSNARYTHLSYVNRLLSDVGDNEYNTHTHTHPYV